MFDVIQVTRIALKMGYYELAKYLEDNRSEYTHFIIWGDQNKIDENKGDRGGIQFAKGEDFVQWLDHTDLPFKISVKEAGIVLGYLEGSGYSLEANGKQLYLCDDVNQEKEITDFGEVIEKASDMNYELLQEAKEKIANTEIHEDTRKEEERLSGLSADEKILDQVIMRLRVNRSLVVENKGAR